MNYQRPRTDFSLQPIEQQRKSKTQFAGDVTPESNTAEADDLNKNNHVDKLDIQRQTKKSGLAIH